MRHRWSFQGQQVHYHPGIASHRRIHFRKVTVDFLSADDMHVAVAAVAITSFRIHICIFLWLFAFRMCVQQNAIYNCTQYAGRKVTCVYSFHGNITTHFWLFFVLRTMWNSENCTSFFLIYGVLWWFYFVIKITLRTHSLSVTVYILL